MTCLLHNESDDQTDEKRERVVALETRSLVIACWLVISCTHCHKVHDNGYIGKDCQPVPDKCKVCQPFFTCRVYGDQ